MSAATSASPEAVEALLHQLVDANFVLTDRGGHITRWSKPAEALFGWPAAAMAGRDLLETLGVPGTIPVVGGRIEAAARRRDGSEVPIGFTLVPVCMGQSLEFNAFLAALELVGERDSALMRLQQSHSTVVDWIAAAIAGRADAGEDQPAGTIVAFAPLTGMPPPVAATEDPVLPAVSASPTVPAAEAAAAAGRIAELEETSAQLGSELGDTRAALEQMGAQVEALRKELEASRTELEEKGRSGRQSLESALDETRDELTRLDARLADVRHDELRAGLDEATERLAGFEVTLGAGDEHGDRLARLEEALAAQASALRADLEGTREKLLAVEAQPAEGAAFATHERVDALEKALVDARAKLSALEGATGAAEAQERLEAELTASRERLDQLEQAVADTTREAAPRAEQLEQALAEARERLAGLEQQLGGAREDDPRVTHLADQYEGLRIMVDELTLAGARAAQDEADGDSPAPPELAALLEQARALVAEAKSRAGQAEAQRTAADEAARAAEAHAAEAAGVNESVREAAAKVVAAAEESRTAVAAQTHQAGEHAAKAELVAGTVEEQIARAETMAADAEAKLSTAGEVAAAAEERAATAARDATAIAGHAETAAKAAGTAETAAAQVHEALAPLERQLGRAAEAAEAADRHAERAAGHSRTAETHTQALTAAQEAAERLVARAETAAAAAEQAAAAVKKLAHQRLAEAIDHPLEAGAPTAYGNGNGGETAPSAPAPAPAVAGGRGANDLRRPLFARASAEAPREPRPGFDDAPAPMACIKLDGHFLELNSAFSDLVGYPEVEFKAATWPPVTDRANLGRHREQLQSLVAGKIEAAEVNTSYVHAQGLLVPVVGRISLVRDGGEPSHFLLEVAGD